ncbi:MAG TPA: hypothetical protein PLQ56_14170 [Aggregatilineales bacterium]|nr:hypothetical protein [Aggregatilineales bacterium]
MPYKVDWYIDKQVVHVKMWGRVPVEEYAAYFRDCFDAYDQSDYPTVHTIVDARCVLHNPNLLEIKRALPKENHPRVGWVLSVVDSPANTLIRMVVNTVSKLSNQRLRHFNEVDAAVEFLRHMDPEIDWSLARAEVLQFSPAEQTRSTADGIFPLAPA